MAFLGMDFMSKKIDNNTTNNASYDFLDESTGAGDGSILSGQDTNITVNTTTTNSDADLAKTAVNDLSYNVGQALGVVVNSQGLNAQALAVAAATQSLQGYLADGSNALAAQYSKENTAIAKLYADEAAATARQQSRDNATTLDNALQAAKQSQAAANNLTMSITGDAIAASRASAAAAANAASDSIFAVKDVNTRSLGFAEDALISVVNSQRTALGFADTALNASTNASLRAATSAENSLDSSLAFARLTQSGNLGFLDTILGDVIKLVSNTAETTQSEAQATRDFSGKFVGDFYESQKSGDVQTIQNIAKYAGVVGVALALAWAVKSSK